MARARPIALDGRIGHGASIVASRATPGDRSVPGTGPVTHGYAVVVYCTGGRARVEQRGEWSLGAGDVLLVPAGELHRTLEMRRLEYWGLQFCVPCLASGGAAALLESHERVRDGGSAVVRIPAARRELLATLFRELETDGHGRDAVRTSLLTLILAEIDRAAGARATRRPRGGVVVESLRFIERNCLRRLTLGEVAAAVGRSPAYVTTALTKATGRSVVDWIVSGRMAEARRLLLHSDEMVDVIAERVGYADATHFIRMFRRAHGATPAAWRAGHHAR